MLDRIRRLFRYDRWANAQALGSAGEDSSRPQRLMAHIAAAEWLWLARLRTQRPPVPVWPEWNGPECERQLAALEPAWDSYLAGLTGAGLGETVDYVNSKGERWSSTVEDVLLHVVLHGAYHRGQVAASVREAGAEPAYTDYIHAVRQRLLE